MTGNKLKRLLSVFTGGGTIWATLTGRLPGAEHASGAVLELLAF